MTRVDVGAVLIAADTAWYERVLDWLSRVGGILTAVLAAIALVGISRSVYRRTLGRRRDRYARLRRLGTNAQLSFFSSVLGEPPAMERTLTSSVTSYDEQGPIKTPKEFKESIWIDRDRDFYVHALTDEDGTVHAYSVTTRSKRFHPTFQIPGGTAEDPTWLDQLRGRDFHFKPNAAVTLGKTRFAELGRPGQAAAWIGAHNWHYLEPYDFANPGYYQKFVLSINDAGAGTPPFSPDWLPGFSWGFGEEPLDPQLTLAKVAIEADRAEAEGESWDDDALQPEVDELNEANEEELVFEDPPLPPELVAFRRRARVNTYTVIGPDLAIDDYPLAQGQRLDQGGIIFGVSSYRVRTLGGE